MKLTQKYLAPVDGGGAGSSASTLDYSTLLISPELDAAAKNKIREVGDLLLQSIDKSDENTLQLVKLLLLQVEEWITHPIFKNERSLLASAIFAHGFGKILCAENLQYIGRIAGNLARMPLYSNHSRAQLEYIASDLEMNFNDNFIRNAAIHSVLNSELGSYKKHYKYFTTEEKDPLVAQQYFVCMKLMEQIEGEIATNSISTLNGHPEIYRSHYFDFIAGMGKSYPTLLKEYKCIGVQGLEHDYMKRLQALLESGGDDAIAAVTLMSESFIGLTYKVILQYVLNDEILQNNIAAKELHTFYQGHIELDGVDEVGATDTHFEMVKHMLTKVTDRQIFLQSCKDFIALRNNVHNELI